MDTIFQGSPNGGATNNSVKDKQKADSINKLRMYSSKSMVIAPQNKLGLDSFRSRGQNKSISNRRTMMSSSKSVTLVNPSYLNSDDTSFLTRPVKRNDFRRTKNKTPFKDRYKNSGTTNVSPEKDSLKPDQK